MTGASSRSGPGHDRDDSDEWLIDAARRARHPLPTGARPAGTSAWRMLLNAGLSDAEVLNLACGASGTDPADFSRLSPALAELLSHSVALKHRVAPLGVHRGALSIATSNPQSPALERALAFASKQRVRLFAASPADILAAQARIYGQLYGASIDFGSSIAPSPAPAPPPPPREPVARLSISMPMPAVVRPGAGKVPEEPREEPQVAETPVASTVATAPAAPAASATPDLTDRLLGIAVAEGASEAILEPTPDGGILVRLRIDGSLIDRFRISDVQAGRVLESLKAHTGIRPGGTGTQRGRATHATASGPISLRIAVYLLKGGRERVVLRLFSSADLRSLAEIGLAATERHRLATMLEARAGLVVIAGPAGSGVTTTLHAAAGAIRTGGRAVCTVEDGVDFVIPALVQTTLADSPDGSLASAVAAIDGPDGAVVIAAPLDAPTVAACAAARVRARLIVATLPTSTAPATLARLRELHPDPASLAKLLHGVVVLQLVRRLCDACAVPQSAAELPESQQQLLYGLPAAKLRGPVGCAECRNTGYRGRGAIASIVEIVPELRAAIARGAADAELSSIAREQGITTLWDSGMSRVLDGTTSLAELLDTVPAPADDESAAPQEDIDALLMQLLGTPHMQPNSVVSSPPIDAALEAALEPAPVDEDSAPAPPPVEGPVRVLIVDDDGDARRRLAAELTSAGFVTLQAADGEAALAYVQRLRPDVVLTEVALPKLDAIGLLGALASDASAPAVLILTAQADDAMIAWLRQSGAQDVLSRESDSAEIAERVRAAAAAR